MKILISGAGIAGPTLAYWLVHYGMEPTIVEEAPILRTGGYVIDFFGAGFDIAERMGLLQEILTKGYQVQEVRVVNQAGRRVAGFSAESFWRVAGGRYTSLPRCDLAASIFGSARGKIQTIFGDSITKIEQSPTSVHVTFKNGPRRDFDLVVGAVAFTREFVNSPSVRKANLKSTWVIRWQPAKPQATDREMN